MDNFLLADIEPPCRSCQLTVIQHRSGRSFLAARRRWPVSSGRVAGHAPERWPVGSGIRKYPAATIAFYGPDNEFASKVAVGIIPYEGAEAGDMEKWSSKLIDVRNEPSIGYE